MLHRHRVICFSGFQNLLPSNHYISFLLQFMLRDSSQPLGNEQLANKLNMHIILVVEWHNVIKKLDLVLNCYTFQYTNTIYFEVIVVFLFYIFAEE